MRHRINISITPAYYNELQRICKDYGFSNLCEICTALLSVFIERVNDAEGRKGNKVESNEELIKKMFAEFENWEPTPQPDIMYRRHQRRNPDKIHRAATRVAATESASRAEDPGSDTGDWQQSRTIESVYDLDYTERSDGPGSEADGELYDY